VHRIVSIPSVEEFLKLSEAKDGVVVDIRNAEDYEAKHLPDADHINLMSQRFVEYFSDLKRDTDLFLYCTDGSRSKVAVRILTEMGFHQLYNLQNGINGWDGTHL